MFHALDPLMSVLAMFTSENELRVRISELFQVRPAELCRESVVEGGEGGMRGSDGMHSETSEYCSTVPRPCTHSSAPCSC